MEKESIEKDIVAKERLEEIRHSNTPQKRKKKGEPYMINKPNR